jgi:hypothetical protein
MAAFRHAVSQGTQLLELDVHMTKDGQVVVSHDHNLSRTAGVVGAVERRLPLLTSALRPRGALTERRDIFPHLRRAAAAAGAGAATAAIQQLGASPLALACSRSWRALLLRACVRACVAQREPALWCVERKVPAAELRLPLLEEVFREFPDTCGTPRRAERPCPQPRPPSASQRRLQGPGPRAAREGVAACRRGGLDSARAQVAALVSKYAREDRTVWGSFRQDTADRHAPRTHATHARLPFTAPARARSRRLHQLNPRVHMVGRAVLCGRSDRVRSLCAVLLRQGPAMDSIQVLHGSATILQYTGARRADHPRTHRWRARAGELLRRALHHPELRSRGLSAPPQVRSAALRGDA